MKRTFTLILAAVSVDSLVAGVKFRRDDIISGPRGSQIWVSDPSGNLIEVFQPKE
jgi:hypothetical protein